MNFLDMTKDDIRYYNRIKMPESDLDWVLKNLAIFTAVVVIATLIMIWS